MIPSMTCVAMLLIHELIDLPANQFSLYSTDDEPLLTHQATTGLYRKCALHLVISDLAHIHFLDAPWLPDDMDLVIAMLRRTHHTLMLAAYTNVTIATPI